ncbi:MAG TPA: PAS domain-containing protein [Bacteroidetes bacterium]|nr:PAS domain-containing protein [Bacteroidota bacterium]
MSDSDHDNRFFKVILSSIADGVFTVDQNRCITSFNPAAERITGTPVKHALGKKCYEIFHSDICETGCLLEKSMRTGLEAIDIPVHILDSNDRRIPISISTAVLRDDDGNVLGAVETFRDLSAIEDLRKQLEKSYSFEDIITKSPILLKILSILPDVAESESTVLIQGPSGSGKELFARAIHNLSFRRKKPYVVINCGTLPPQLFESEIFGYMKGAFTDAKHNKPGKLTAAEGGTVFFDEIGELPLSTQVKLLRLLQQREYEPLGSVTPKKADIRIVAATNRDLRKLVEKGKFRDDLYFRLAVIRFDLPPLKDRRMDIPYLVDHFIRLFNARKGRNLIGVAPGVMSVLMRHDFPGNIRELENIIEYGYAVCHDRTLAVEHLPVELQSQASSTEQYITETGATPLKRASMTEEDLIRQTLKYYDGNRTKTAVELGMDRTTLWRKMRRFNIR